MSFGYSVGDFLALTQLAYRTVQNARKACGAHADLTREVSSLHIVLQRVETEVTKPDSILNETEDDRKKELRTLTSHCKRVLEVLQQVLEKYNALSDEQRSVTRLWQKVKFGNGEMQDLDKIRVEIAAHTQALNLFLNLLSIGSQGKVQKYMDSHGEELRDIKHSLHWITALMQATNHEEGSILTTYLDDDKAIWKDFRRELIEQGFSSKILHKHKHTIQEYVMELGRLGALDDPVPLDTSIREPATAAAKYTLRHEMTERLASSLSVAFSHSQTRFDFDGTDLEELDTFQPLRANDSPSKKEIGLNHISRSSENSQLQNTGSSLSLRSNTPPRLDANINNKKKLNASQPHKDDQPPQTDSTQSLTELDTGRVEPSTGEGNGASLDSHNVPILSKEAIFSETISAYRADSVMESSQGVASQGHPLLEANIHNLAYVERHEDRDLLKEADACAFSPMHDSELVLLDRSTPSDMGESTSSSASSESLEDFRWLEGYNESSMQLSSVERAKQTWNGRSEFLRAILRDLEVTGPPNFVPLTRHALEQQQLALAGMISPKDANMQEVNYDSPAVVFSDRLNFFKQRFLRRAKYSGLNCSECLANLSKTYDLLEGDDISIFKGYSPRFLFNSKSFNPSQIPKQFAMNVLPSVLGFQAVYDPQSADFTEAQHLIASKNREIELDRFFWPKSIIEQALRPFAKKGHEGARFVTDKTPLFVPQNTTPEDRRGSRVLDTSLKPSGLPLLSNLLALNEKFLNLSSQCGNHLHYGKCEMPLPKATLGSELLVEQLGSEVSVHSDDPSWYLDSVTRHRQRPKPSRSITSTSSEGGDDSSSDYSDDCDSQEECDASNVSGAVAEHEISL